MMIQSDLLVGVPVHHVDHRGHGEQHQPVAPAPLPAAPAAAHVRDLRRKHRCWEPLISCHKQWLELIIIAS